MIYAGIECTSRDVCVPDIRFIMPKYGQKNKKSTSLAKELRYIVLFSNGFQDGLCKESDLVTLAMKKSFKRFFCQKRQCYGVILFLHCITN